MLVLFSMALFVVAAPESVQAQSGAAKDVTYCFQTSSGKFFTALAGPSCHSDLVKATAPSADKGYCVFKPANSSTFGYTSTSVNPATGSKPYTDTNGNKCLEANISEPNKPPAETGDFVSFASITQAYTQGGGTVPSPANNTKPPIGSNNNGSGSSGSGTVPPQVPCEKEPGFHKVGPLCVPDSPFDKDSIAGGNQTAGSLAVRIIRILLYFAAIVAVIMMIIGGYYVMTARGNEAQALSGRKTLTNAIIGLAIIILSYVIIQVVISFLTK